MIVLDTSAVLYWTQKRTMLSEPALRAIGAAQEIVIPSIVFWEVGWKQKMGKLRMPVSADELHAMVQQIDRATITPTTSSVWLQTVALDWDHRDPADRVIVATALLNRCPLVTSDGQIRQFYSAAIW